MSAGKEKCDILRRIRQDVAEKYGLNYSPTECNRQGDCSGTCPKCDAELKDLQRQLALRGITDIDLTNIPIETYDVDYVHNLEGEIVLQDYYIEPLSDDD